MQNQTNLNVEKNVPKCSRASILATHILDHLPHPFHFSCIVLFHSMSCLIDLSITISYLLIKVCHYSISLLVA